MTHSRSPHDQPERHEKAEKTEKQHDPKHDGSKRSSHHVRRKSGGPRAADEKKRPSLSRRTTPQHVKTSSGRRDRDRDRDDDAGRDRDGGESFPQFCMTCEKQFLPANSTILYCSESCRLHDQAPASTRPQSFSTFPSLSPPASPYYQHQHIFPSDGPDIIPRFSPTQSRPRSYFNSDSYPASASYHPSSTSHFSSSRNITTAAPATTSRSSTALASLRDLAASLPRQDPSPPRSPSAAVWSYIPFAQQPKTTTPTPSATPGTSYGSPPRPYGGELGADPFAAGPLRRNSSYVGAYGVGVGMDRPLPPRSGPGGYGNRGRNIDLVTPFAAGL